MEQGCTALENVVKKAKACGDSGFIQLPAVVVEHEESRKRDADAEKHGAGDSNQEDGGQLVPRVALLVHVLLPVAAAPGGLRMQCNAACVTAVFGAQFKGHDFPLPSLEA
jgi:hypothetical protein